jgi:hypothetical protein
MGKSYKTYERKCEKLKKDNAAYLDTFRKSLEAAGLSKKTVNRHCDNADFYLNDFLLRYEPCPMQDGCVMAGSFLGDFLIRKCLWSTPASIKDNAASLKKFYKCMLAEGRIDADDYRCFLDVIKDEMEDWLDECEAFNGFDERW